MVQWLAQDREFWYHKSMLTLIIFILVISVLVLVHELGHFWTAKRAGMKVEEFGFGFPPRIFGLKKGETIYSINLIPFGGFVKIFGEDDNKEKSNGSFASAKAGTRAFVIVAGVLMNVLLAVVLLGVGNFIGLRVGLVDEQTAKIAKDLKIQVAQIEPESPAQKAGLRQLDEIIGFKINGEVLPIASVKEVQNIVDANRGREIAIEIRRGKEMTSHPITPRENPPENQGALGVSLLNTGIVKFPWYQAIWRGIRDTGVVLVNTAFGYSTVIKNLLTTGSAGVQLSGPVGIAVVTGQAARLGFSYLLQLTALISVNLAILNIIPFPALDGGRLLFIIIEKIKGSPVPKSVEAAVNAFGFVMLIILMIAVTTKDILRFFA